MDKNNQLTAYEIGFLLSELKEYENSYLVKITNDSTHFIIKLHNSDAGKKNLVLVNSTLYLTKKIFEIPRPKNFSQYLRKYINNAKITKISMLGIDRIIIFELFRGEKYYLVFELFNKGNILLLNKDGIMLNSLLRLSGTKTSKKEDYFSSNPRKELNEFTKDELFELFSKDSIVKTLARDLGFGKTYAEEMCNVHNLNKDKIITEIDELDDILNSIDDFIKKQNQAEKTSYVYKKNNNLIATPIKLTTIDESKIISTTDDFSKAIEQVISEKTKTLSKEEEIVSKLENTYKIQSKQINILDEKSKKAKEAGEYIYSKYEEINKMLNDFKKEIPNDKIKEINKKEKFIIIDV
jgi:predicted ribosome quality control (RQC) complex YloA/Tae2 family protein